MSKTKPKADEVLIDCGGCKGAGVFSGKVEAKGEAVICFKCKGTGSQLATRFTGRKRFPSGINMVRWPNGSQGITYNDFLAGRMPPE